MSTYSFANTRSPTYSIQQTFSGSTLVQIFDNTPKVTRPQMPMSFVNNGLNDQDPFMNNQMPSTAGRRDFRFYTVRAAKLGNPINITIEPPLPEADGMPTSFSNPQNFESNMPFQEFQSNGYTPFPAKSPQEVYRPVSYTDNRNSKKAKKSKKFFPDNIEFSDAGSSISGSSSSSSESEDVEGKNIFHYLEFALVSILVNPIFGVVAVILSCKYKPNIVPNV